MFSYLKSWIPILNLGPGYLFYSKDCNNLTYFYPANPVWVPIDFKLFLGPWKAHNRRVVFPGRDFWREGEVLHGTVLLALPEAMVELTSNLVEGPLRDQQYTQRKFRLLSETSFIRLSEGVEKLSHICPLGAQQPSEFLAAMLKLCPKRRKNRPSSHISSCIVPRELWVLLSDEDHIHRCALAVKVYRLWGHNVQHAHDKVATVSRESNMEDNTVCHWTAAQEEQQDCQQDQRRRDTRACRQLTRG